ncbi:MAG: prenyltransferase/squalene oxidase repeat-containing protein [Planctomycetota bacterium]
MSQTLTIREIEARGHDDVLVEALKGTPWVALSGLMHVAIVLLLLLFTGTRETRPELPAAAVALEDLDTLEEPVEPEKEEPELEPTEEQPEDVPTVENTSEHDEDPAEEIWSEESGETDAEFDKPMDALSNADVVGVGANAGGDFGGRRGGRDRVRRGGGARDQSAVDHGLDWLARHQSPDGRWDADEFMKNGDRARGPLCDGPGGALHDVGLSGLSLLAFLGAGETHRAGNYRDTVRRGLRWLLDQQDAEGCFGPRTSAQFTYDHAIATLAICEAYGLTRSPLFREGATRGVRFCLDCQNPYAGWRYGVSDGENDTSVTGWMVMVLKSARMAGIPVDDTPMKWALGWIEKMTDEDTGRTGYLDRGGLPVREEGRLEAFPAAEVESLTAVAVLSRVFGGQDPASHRTIKAGAELLTEKMPLWDESRGSIDMYYWYYGTLAMFQVGGPGWEAWNRAMQRAVVDTQRGVRKGGEPDNFTGSWDPKGAWGENGGRIYSTAIMTLCLEVYYRYGKVFGAK